MARRSNPEQNPTLRGRRLAVELQRRREATGMSREEVARQLEWSTSTIFRIETGRSRPQPGNVRTLLELYGVTGPERDGLIQLTRDARQPGWWRRNAGRNTALAPSATPTYSPMAGWGRLPNRHRPVNHLRQVTSVAPLP